MNRKANGIMGLRSHPYTSASFPTASFGNENKSTPSERDRVVFERLGHLPLVWNLAGGYQIAPGNTEAQKREPILALHRETARLHTAILG